MADRVAALVDGDNISAPRAFEILHPAGKLGRVDIARLDGAGTEGADWPGSPGHRFVHAGAGKNAADLLLAIDAIGLALSTALAGIAIASSDRDPWQGRAQHAPCGTGPPNAQGPWNADQQDRWTHLARLSVQTAPTLRSRPDRLRGDGASSADGFLPGATRPIGTRAVSPARSVPASPAMRPARHRHPRNPARCGQPRPWPSRPLQPLRRGW